MTQDQQAMTPWSVEKFNRNLTTEYQPVNLIMPNGKTVRIAHDAGGDAYAERIALACSMHDILVEALRKIQADDDHPECCGVGVQTGFSAPECCAEPRYGIDRAKDAARIALAKLDVARLGALPVSQAAE
jgi:hypothetical protein